MAMAVDALGHERLIAVGHCVSGTTLPQTWLGLDSCFPYFCDSDPPAFPNCVTEWNELQLVRLNVIDGPSTLGLASSRLRIQQRELAAGLSQLVELARQHAVDQLVVVGAPRVERFPELAFRVEANLS